MRHFKVIMPSLFVATYLEIVIFSAGTLDTPLVFSLLFITLLSWLDSHLDKTIIETLGAETEQIRQERDEKAREYQNAIQILDIAGERFEVAEEEIEILQSESNQKSLQLQRVVSRIHARSQRLRAAHAEMYRLRTGLDNALAANEAKDVEIGRLVKELQDAFEAKSRMEEDMLRTQGELIRGSMRLSIRDEGTTHGIETGLASEVNCLGNPALTFGLF